ncbi:MAG: hypothetical protein ACQCXQ_14460, partial [Verrucomicrobiales bacterium]
MRWLVAPCGLVEFGDSEIAAPWGGGKERRNVFAGAGGTWVMRWSGRGDLVARAAFAGQLGEPSLPV